MLLVESAYSHDLGKMVNHARSLETFCSRNGIRVSLMNRNSETPKSAAAFRTPFTSPLFTGSFPSSPLVYSPPELGPRMINRIDFVPPLSLDGIHTGKVTECPPISPACREPPLPVKTLHDKLQNLTQIGVIHLALQNDSKGSILRFVILLVPVISYFYL